MSKALVFEGCPTCSSSLGGYGKVAVGGVMPYVSEAAVGGLYGAGGVIAVDFLLPKILPNLSPLVRSAITGVGLLATSFLLKDKYPEQATGIGIGGGGIVMYKVIASLLGKIVPATVTPMTGLDGVDGLGEPYEDEEDVEIDEDPPYGMLTAEEEESDELGVLVAEELGQEDLIIE